MDDADLQEAERNPFYAEGKRLRDRVTTKTANAQDWGRAALAFGVAILADRYQRQQEDKKWVRGVERNVYYDSRSGGLIITDQPVEILPNSYFPSVRPAR